MPAQEAKEWGWARWNDSHALCPPRMADEEDPTSLGDPQVGTKENTAKSPGSRKHTWLSVRMWVLLPSVITEMTDTEPRLQKPPVKLYSDFLLYGWLPSLTPKVFKGQRYLVFIPFWHQNA